MGEKSEYPYIIKDNLILNQPETAPFPDARGEDRHRPDHGLDDDPTGEPHRGGGGGHRGGGGRG